MKHEIWFLIHSYLGRVIWRVLKVLCFFKIHIWKIEVDKEWHNYYQKVMMHYNCRICKQGGYYAAPKRFQLTDKPERYRK